MLLLLLQVHVSVGVLHVLVCGAQRRTARGQERDLPKEAGWLSVFSSGSCWELPHVVLGVDYSILLTLQSVCSFVEMCVFEDGLNGHEDRDVSSLKPMA